MTTIGHWLTEVKDLPRLDCEILLGGALEVNRAHILAFPEKEIPPNICDGLQDQVDELRKGIPLAYIMGEREFWGLPFSVSHDVLIPRPETELLVELALDLTPTNGRLLDLGTGSGAIAIAISHSRADIEVTAIDASAAALAIAKQNSARNNTNVCFKTSCWFNALSGRWDVIVANPPYVSPNDPHLHALRYEPSSALVAEDEGLADVAQIVRESPAFLQERGQLIIEHGYNQAERTRAMFVDAGFSNIRSLQDLAKIERATLGCL